MMLKQKRENDNLIALRLSRSQETQDAMFPSLSTRLNVLHNTHRLCTIWGIFTHLVKRYSHQPTPIYVQRKLVMIFVDIASPQ